jgi:hypothetical protein
MVNIQRYLNRDNIILSFAGLILIFVVLKWVVKPDASDIASYAVTKGAFIISINQGGELLAKNSVTISAPPRVRGGLQIVELALEG